MTKPSKFYFSLHSILQTYNCPLDEVQAWSLCYQLMKSCGFFDLSISSTNYDLKSEKHLSVDSIFVSDTGDIRCGSESVYDEFTENDVISWLSQVGGVLYHCLDFGLADGEERELTDGVCLLIESLTGATPEKDDEGIERDEESPVFGIIARVRQMCEAVSEDRGQSPGSHHAAVCRAMYWHVRELQDFLNGVGHVEANSEEERHLRDLNRHVWVSLWTQVMEDLRRGVRLRAVKNSERLPSQQRLFELTPYEMLMEDIRLRRYTLRRTERPAVPGYLRASAHEMILEYIRSRPPLKPVEHRVLSRAPPPSPTPRDKTLEMIRNGDFTLREVARPVENRFALQRPRRKRRIIKPDFNLNDLSDEDEAFPELWELVTDSRDSAAQPPPPSESMDELRASFRRRIAPMVTPEISALRRASTCSSETDLRRDVCVRRMRDRRRDSDVGCHSAQLSRRPPPRSLQRPDSDDDLSDASSPSPLPLRPRHSLVSCRSRSPALDDLDSHSDLARPRRCSLDARLSSGGLSRRSRGFRDSGIAVQEEDADDGDLSGSTSMLARPRSASVSYGHGPEARADGQTDLGEARSPLRRQNAIGRRSVRLSLTEVSLIRSTLAKAELEALASDKKLYDKMRRERVCFICRKTEFGLLRWGKKCGLCQKMVCANCRTKANLPSNRSAPLGDFLVNSLAPADGPQHPMIDSKQSSTNSNETPSSRGLRRHQSFLGSVTPTSQSENAIVCKRCACIGYISNSRPA